MNKIFSLLLGLSLIAVACEPNAGDKPNDKPTSQYVLDVEMQDAERILDQELADNVFAIIFTNDDESISLGMTFVGNAEDVALQAGRYSTNAGTLDVEGCALQIATEDAVREFVGGEAVVEFDGEVYRFDVIMMDAERGLYHFTYSGVVKSMVIEGVAFEPVKVVAERYNHGNFYLQFYIDEYYYHELDVYDNVGRNPDYLSAGTYTMDDTQQQYIGYQWSIFALGNGGSCALADAELTLSHAEDGKTTIRGFIKSVYGDCLLIDWTGVVEGFNLIPKQEYDGYEFSYLVGQYYAPNYWGEEYDQHNYYIMLSTADPSSYAANAVYLSLDMWAATGDAETLVIPEGEYVLDFTDSGAAGTLGEGYTKVEYTDAYGTPTEVRFSSCTIVVGKDKIEGSFVEESGQKVNFIYRGTPALPVKKYSTLTGDAELNFSGLTAYANYLDSYQEVVTNYVVELLEDPDTFSGAYFILDVLSDFNLDYYATSSGVTYKALIDGSEVVNTFIPAGFDTNGSFAGSWYIDVEEGNVGDAMVPFMDGTITAVYDSHDGTHTITLDCVDDCGNRVTGTITGHDEEASALSARRGVRCLAMPKSIVIR